MARYLTWGLLGLVGLTGFVMALDFGWGGGPQMGSAPLPLALSAGLVAVALWGLLARPEGDEFLPSWRPFAAVIAGVVLFILTIDRLGLVPATLIAMVVSYLGQIERRYLGFLLYALPFAGAVWLLFGIGLGLPVPAFGGR